MSPLETARAVHASLPEGGLFHEKEWRIAARPFELPEGFSEELEKLGYRLTLFLRACDLLYRQSVKGRQPAWVAELLDAGKPTELVEFQRECGIAGEIPKVVRPDLVLTETGYVIAEIDSVPGGIGLVDWLNKAYADSGCGVLGGAEGMMKGFAGIFPGGDIVVSEEAATYRPEMEWLAGRLNAGLPGGGPWRVTDAESRSDRAGRVYRFFELFDLANVPAAGGIMERLRAGAIEVTPPFKPALEEKLWMALFWLKPLEDYWRRELGERAFLALKKVIPYSWLVDPAPIPRHAVLPRLEAHSWDEVAKFSQKRRDFVLKVSGFSDRAWGSRGVVVGSDISQREWQAALEEALREFGKQPRILQVFHHGKMFDAEYWKPGEDHLEGMRGRVRLCPYFFVGEKSTVCGGALATICPDDKKLLHGMRDAILAPCAG